MRLLILAARVLLLPASLWAAPANAAVLAECAAPTGMAYYLARPTWEPDAFTGGAWQFSHDDKGNPNVIYRDSTGQVTDAAADGASITVSFIHAAHGEFGYIVLYAKQGIVETYNILRNKEGSRILFYTSNRSSLTGLPKIAAFVAQCR